MKRQPNIIRFLLRTLVCVALVCVGAGAQAGSIDPSTGQIVALPPAHISEVTLESTAEGKIIANHNGKRYELVELAEATAGRLAARLAGFYELSNRLSHLPDKGTQFLADFANASDDVIKQLGNQPELVDAWEVLYKAGVDDAARKEIENLVDLLRMIYSPDLGSSGVPKARYKALGKIVLESCLSHNNPKPQSIIYGRNISYYRVFQNGETLLPSLNLIEKIIRYQDVEWKVVCDPKGCALAIVKGDYDGVAYPKDIDLEGTIVTHNHPVGSWESALGIGDFGGSSFSIGDIKNACENRVNVFRAVVGGTDGSTVYQIKRLNGENLHMVNNPIDFLTITSLNQLNPTNTNLSDLILELNFVIDECDIVEEISVEVASSFPCLSKSDQGTLIKICETGFVAAESRRTVCFDFDPGLYSPEIFEQLEKRGILSQLGYSYSVLKQ